MNIPEIRERVEHERKVANGHYNWERIIAPINCRDAIELLDTLEEAIGLLDAGASSGPMWWKDEADAFVTKHRSKR